VTRPAPPAGPRVIALVALGATALAVAGCGSRPSSNVPASPGGPPSPGGGEEMAARPAPGPPAPPLDANDLDGAKTDLARYRGHPVIINFWATWCQPCRREMPSLVRLHERLKGDGLVVLAVSIDADPQSVRKFLAETPLSFPVLLDPGRAAAERYGVVTIPSSFVLDQDGLVVERIDGEADWTGAELLTTLDVLLKRRARAAGAGNSGDAS
jgi:cytochrome c biogenesis protein CcmG, thiol:disulfide interchange protein DsbE